MGNWVIPFGQGAIACLWATLIVGFLMRPMRRRFPKLNLLPLHKTLALAAGLLSVLHVLGQIL